MGCARGEGDGSPSPLPRGGIRGHFRVRRRGCPKINEAPVEVALAGLEEHPEASQKRNDIVLYIMLSQYHSGERVLL